MNRGGADDPAALIDAARRGEDWAVAELYRSIQPDLLRYLRAQAGAAAEDLASETWIGVARALPRFKGDAEGLRRLAFTIARRRMLDERRRLARDRSDDRDATARLAQVAAAETTDLSALSRMSSEAAIAFVHDVLPPDQAEILLLRVVAGLSAEETAAVTGKRPGTIRVIQFRALRRLSEAASERFVTGQDTKAI